MTVITSPRMQILALAMAFLTMIGCADPPPQPEDGPLPRTPNSTSLKRMRVWTGSWPSTRGQATKWDVDGHLVWPGERVAPIRAAIEATLHEDLTRTQIAQAKDGRSFERPATYVHAVVVSLSPDIAIAAVRHNAVDSMKSPFDEWSMDISLERIPVERAVGGPPGGGPFMSVGLIAPFAEEMYVVSGDVDVPAQKIRFENRTAEVTVQNAILNLRHEGNVVRVDVEYR